MAAAATSIALAWWKSYDINSKRAALVSARSQQRRRRKRTTAPGPWLPRARATSVSTALPLQDEQAKEIAARHVEGVESRRALTEAVKAYRRLSDEEKSGSATASVMKLLQDEVDALLKRARLAEKAFSGVFKDLVEAVDPSPALAAASDAEKALARATEENARLTAALAAASSAAERGTSEQSGEVARLRADVAELEGELSKLSNQDITIRELEKRLTDFEGTLDSQVAGRLAERESELRRVFDAELETVREAETAAEGRVASLAAALDEAAAARDEAQAALWSIRSRGGGGGGGAGGQAGSAGGADDGGGGGSSHEADVLAQENDRLSAQISSLSAEAADLRQQLATAAAAAAGEAPPVLGSTDPFAVLRAQCESYRTRALAAEAELAKTSAALALLQEEERRWSAMLDDARAACNATVATVEARLRSREAEVAVARAEAASRPSHAEVSALRQQLATLQAMAFSTGSGGDDESSASSTSTSAAGGSAGGTADAGGNASSSSSSVNAGSSGSSGGTGEPPVDVHALMLRRVRQLDARLVRSEAAKTAAEAAAAALLKEVESLRESGADAATLIAKLEDELALRLGADAVPSTQHASALFRSVSGFNSGGGGGSDPLSSPPRSGGASASGQSMALMSPQMQLESMLGGGGQTAQSSSSLSSSFTPGKPASSSLRGALAFGSPPTQSGAALAAGGAVEDTNNGDAATEGAALHAAAAVHDSDTSMILILRGQRDRFRARMLQLEAAAQAQAAAASDTEARAAATKADNVKLYEKIRYLQSFLAGGGGDPDAMQDASARAGGGVAPSSALGGLRSRSTVPGGAGHNYSLAGEDDFERPYRAIYADSLDPFSDFNRREKARLYGRLNAAEKITLSTSRMFLANKLARNFVFFYVVVLHLLVVATLWHFSHVSHKDCGDIHDGGDHGGHGMAEKLLGEVPREIPKSAYAMLRLRGAAAAAAAANGSAADAPALPPPGT